MDEKSILDELATNIEKSIRFFSFSNKQIRGKWIVNEFLKNIGLTFAPHEIIASREDPPDIIFRDSFFEIKEILDEGRERHREYKENLEKTKEAKSLKDLFTSYSLRDIRLQDLIKIVGRGMSKKKYEQKFSATLNLMFYFNPTSTSISDENSFELSKDEEWTRYRTVSVVGNGGFAFVIYAADDAPDFLKKIEGEVFRNPKFL